MAMALPELADADGGQTGLSGSDGGADGNTLLAGDNPTAMRAAPGGQTRNDAFQDGLADVVFLPRV